MGVIKQTDVKPDISNLTDASSMSRDIKLLDLKSNRSIIDKMTEVGTDDYQQVVTSTTQGNMKSIMKKLQDPLNKNFFNVFADNLMNMVGMQLFRDTMLTNPLAKLPRIKINDMKAIQEIGQGIIKAKTYDHNIGDKLFDRDVTNPRVAYHTVNRREYFAITVNKTELMNAFITEGGLATYIRKLYDKLRSSDNIAEYLAMKDVFQVYDEEHNMFNVKVGYDDTGAELATVKLEMEDLIQKIRETSGYLKLPSAVYNAYGMPTQTMEGEMVFITTPKVTSNVDVKVLAGAFNRSFTDFTTEVIEIDAFPYGLQKDGTYGVLMDKKAFIIADALLNMTSFYNPLAMEVTYWLHHWQILSMSPFLNIIKFSQADDTPINQVSFTPTSLDAMMLNYDGNVQTFANVNTGDDKKHDLYVRAVLSGTSTDNKKVKEQLSGTVYTITGAKNASGVAIVPTEKTFIDYRGVLHLQDDLKVENASVSITMESTYFMDGYSSAVSKEVSIEIPIGKEPEAPALTEPQKTLAHEELISQIKAQIMKEMGNAGEEEDKKDDKKDNKE